MKKLTQDQKALLIEIDGATVPPVVPRTPARDRLARDQLIRSQKRDVAGPAGRVHGWLTTHAGAEIARALR